MSKFQKGKSGNPSGRPKSDPTISAFKETTYKEFIEALQKYGRLTKDESNVILEDPKSTMFEIMFCQIVYSAARGDKDARQLLLDRLWGKVKEQSQLEIIDPVKEKIKAMSDAELAQYVKENLKDK